MGTFGRWAGWKAPDIGLLSLLNNPPLREVRSKLGDPRETG
jgi:hypothetical protein